MAAPSGASPDGAEWEVARDPEGCLSCHFDSPDPSNSEALGIAGLPKRPEPGKAYALTLVLSDPALENAGFMLSVTAGGAPAGKLDSVDGETETNGTIARQTREGSVAAEPGSRAWRLTWTAPAGIESPLSFELWGNAGNGDQSPLGDTLHHRIWRLPEP